METYADTSKMSIIVIGNKSDLLKEQRRVSFSRGKIFAEERQFQFFETSALNNPQLINEIFQLLANNIIKNHHANDLKAT